MRRLKTGVKGSAAAYKCVPEYKSVGQNGQQRKNTLEIKSGGLVFKPTPSIAAG